MSEEPLHQSPFIVEEQASIAEALIEAHGPELHDGLPQPDAPTHYGGHDSAHIQPDMHDAYLSDTTTQSPNLGNDGIENKVTSTVTTIIDLLKQNFDDSYDEGNVGGIKFSGGQSPAMRELEIERDSQVRELLSKGDPNATAQELADVGKSWVVFRYGDDTGIDWDKFGQRLLENGLVFTVAKGLERLPNVDRTALANELMTRGINGMSEVARNLDMYPDIDGLALAKALLDNGCRSQIWANIDQFTAHSHNQAALASLFIDDGQAMFVASNIERFPGVDRKQLASALGALDAEATAEAVAALQHRFRTDARPPKD